MMHLQGKKIGDVSNLAAFNTMAQAETFIRNSKSGGANLFAPHSGTLDQSWQFQQHTFSEVVNLALDKNILTSKELIGVFNGTIESNVSNKKAFKQFKEEYFDKYGKRINNFSSFVDDPKAIINLLDIQNNFSPNLRKALNDAISANKKFQKELGIKNKEQFYNLIADPLNAGVKGGEIISVVDFDPNTFQIVKTEPGAIDHHPSFGYTLLAKINGIYQPTEFYKSYDVTETYTKYNKESTEVSKKSDGFEKFAQSNVTSSAGAIPKVAQFDLKSKAQLSSIEETTKALDELANDNPDAYSNLEKQAGVVYHGTEADFEKFDRVGQRIPALGLGYYFTPRLEKAKQYGSKIKKIVLEDAKILNWNKLSDTERDQIKDRLEERMPKSMLGGLGERKEKIFTQEQRQEAADFYKQKREETDNYEYERGKARIKRNGDVFVISWSEEGLGNLNDAELLNFAQRYDNDIAKEMGYDAAKYGDEIAVFNGDKIKNATNEVIAKAYQKAKEDGSNPELVKAVEDLVGKPGIKSKPQLADNNAKEVADLYAEMREGGGWAERQKINSILDRDPKLSYIYNNFKEITRMLEDAKLLTKSVNCP
jgi:hypothetical protein